MSRSTTTVFPFLFFRMRNRAAGWGKALSTGSGVEPLDSPSSGFLRREVDEAVMEAVFPALPKLEAVGDQSKSSPMIRTRDLQSFESDFDFSATLLKFSATWRFMALSGCGRRDLTSSGSGLEVLLDLFAA